VLGAKVLDCVGFVLDYAALDSFGEWLKKEVDHRHLNDVFPYVHPTAENLARVFYEKCLRILNPLQGVRQNPCCNELPIYSSEFGQREDAVQKTGQ
jgi:6-pyruvoyltetrahydropterin/6-carboxytetrahydropterin synthase